MVGDGQTATLNGRAVRMRPTPRLEEATFLTSDPLNPAKYQNGPAYEALTRRTRMVRTWGDCYGYLLLASGWADVMCDPIMNPWDIQALIPIIRGAGGVITDWQGRDPVKAESIVAANVTLHPQVIAALNAK
jgi:myo-inositol-1(or 4)-monophosphatase